LLHYIWRTNLDTFPLFQDLVETLQITPRATRNKKIDTSHNLKFLTWTLNININLIKISQISNTHHQKKFTFYYSFQNTLIKISRTPHKFKPIHIVNYQKKYYILKENPTIFPLLLKGVNPQAQLQYKNTIIEINDIINIIQNKSEQVSFPFTINIYTSYSFVKTTSKEIETNIIGQYIATDSTDDVLHVFLTPDIEKKSLMQLNTLSSVKHTAKFSKYNLFENVTITEGDKTIWQKSPKEITLDQKNCICDHEETHRFTPSPRFHNLGKLHYADNK